MRYALPLVLGAVLFVACGGGDRGKIAALPAGAEYPLAVEGVLVISVEEGPVGDDDLSEINFGTLESDSGTYLIEIDAATVREAGLTRDDLYAGHRVRATLTGESAHGGISPRTYRIGALERVTR